MNKLKEKALELAGKRVKHWAEKEATEWPPSCTGLFFQPERPTQKCPPEKPQP